MTSAGINTHASHEHTCACVVRAAGSAIRGEEKLLIFIKGPCGSESRSVFGADYPEQVCSPWGLNGPH